VSTWSQSHDQDLWFFDSETRYRLAPVTLILVSLPLDLGDFFTPGDESGALLALD
jgi:hypothetical protein